MKDFRHKQAGKDTDDGRIVELYFQRDEDAIRLTKEKYESYLLAVAKNILSDPLDREECLNDLYLKVWNAIPPERPRSLGAFLTTVMRRIAINRYHYNARKKSVPSEMTVSFSELEEVLCDGGDCARAFDAKHLGEVISAYLRTLSPRRRYIFFSRYYIAASLQTIAQELGVSRSTVDKELAAIKSGLKEKLESEGYTP